MNITLNRPLPQRSTLALAALALLAACASVPERNAALDSARSNYEIAQGQNRVVMLAPEELKRANEALRAAELAKSNGAAPTTVDHLAYMAQQRVTIAQASADSRAAQAVTAGAGAERDRMRLALRTQQADVAQRQLASAERDNTRTQQQLADSRQNNARTAAALQSSQQNNAVQAAELDKATAAAQADRDRLARRDAQVGDLQAQLRAIDARKTERGIVVTLGDMLFSTGQARLQGDGAVKMTKLAEFLKRNPNRRASIEGYTDSVGSADSNQALSDRRAHAVMDALVEQGVPSNRLSTEAFGERRPVASNDTVSGRQQNRRVEIVFGPEAGDLLLK